MQTVMADALHALVVLFPFALLSSDLLFSSAFLCLFPSSLCVLCPVMTDGLHAVLGCVLWPVMGDGLRAVLNEWLFLLLFFLLVSLFSSFFLLFGLLLFFFCFLFFFLMRAVVLWPVMTDGLRALLG